VIGSKGRVWGRTEGHQLQLGGMIERSKRKRLFPRGEGGRGSLGASKRGERTPTRKERGEDWVSSIERGRVELLFLQVAETSGAQGRGGEIEGRERLGLIC